MNFLANNCWKNIPMELMDLHWKQHTFCLLLIAITNKTPLILMCDKPEKVAHNKRNFELQKQNTKFLGKKNDSKWFHELNGSSLCWGLLKNFWGEKPIITVETANKYFLFNTARFLIRILGLLWLELTCFLYVFKNYWHIYTLAERTEYSNLIVILQVEIKQVFFHPCGPVAGIAAHAVAPQIACWVLKIITCDLYIIQCRI